MIEPRKSICFFIHYNELKSISLYVKVFVEELASNFDEVILVTNEREIKHKIAFENNNITVFFTENKGYDFGKFYRAYHSINAQNYYRMAVVNDSNILFNKLDKVFQWASDHTFDLWGLIDSHEKPWFTTYSESYHIQSHFLVLEEKAIELLPGYFNTIDINKLFAEENTGELRRKIINHWEIGLSNFFLKKGLQLGSYIDSRWFSETYNQGKAINVGHKLYLELIGAGYPLIKKKIIREKNGRLAFSSKKWQQLIRENGNQSWNLESIINEMLLVQ